MNFKPVCTLAELEALDENEIIEGYVSTGRDDPEPGANRGRSFWHGWRNRMIDYGVIPSDNASRQLAREWVQRS